MFIYKKNVNSPFNQQKKLFSVVSSLNTQHALTLLCGHQMNVAVLKSWSGLGKPKKKLFFQLPGHRKHVLSACKSCFAISWHILTFQMCQTMRIVIAKINGKNAAILRGKNPRGYCFHFINLSAGKRTMQHLHNRYKSIIDQQDCCCFLLLPFIQVSSCLKL